MIGVGSLLGHHVHVSLKGDAFAVFIARSGSLVHQDVAGLVHAGLDMTFGSPVKEEALDFLEMAAGAGNLCEEVEVVPYGTGLKI